MKQTQRLDWIDSLRGIGILFVLLGHTPITFRYYIYPFHIPLFFFASGYLFDSTKYIKFKDFVKRKFNVLAFPYIYFSAISIALYVLYASCGATKETVNFKEIFLYFIAAKRNSIPYNKALWFLPSLFIVSIIYFALKKYVKDNLAIISIAIILSATGYIYFKALIKPKLFWSFDSSLYYLIFYMFGNLSKEIQESDKLINYKTNFIILFWIIVVFINTAIIWNKTLFEQIKFYFNSFLFGIAGIITFAILSKYFLEKWQKINIFKYLGKNSLLIFSLHLSLCWPVVRKIFDIFNINIQNKNLLGLSYAILSIIILIPVIYLINHGGYFLSTLTLRPLKKWWIAKYNNGIYPHKKY